MKLYIVRHGETDWNKSRRIQGQVDIPLNEFGESLARKTAVGLKDIPFAACYSSPLGRAKHTAELILAGRDVEIIEDSRIIEMAFGIYEGKCLSEENDEVPQEFHDSFHHPELYQPPEGAESFEDVLKRTGEFLEDICRKYKDSQENILVTTHGVALAGMLAYIRKSELPEFWGVGVHKNCAVTEVQADKDGMRILSENVVYYDDEVEVWHA
jgi:probable phosphoglycerate mutase